MKDISGKCKFVIALLIPLLVLGCASTDMVSMANPAFAGHRFTTLLVEGGFADLGQREYAEGQLCEYLADYSDVKCIESLKVFFPGEKYTSVQIASQLAELHVDGILMIKPTNSGVVSAYIPPTTQTTFNGTAFTNGSVSSYGNTAYGSSTTNLYGSSTTYTYGGFNVNKPWAVSQVILYSTGSDKVAWEAGASSRGNAFSKWDDLIESTAEKAAKKLVADGVLQPVPKNR